MLKRKHTNGDPQGEKDQLNCEYFSIIQPVSEYYRVKRVLVRRWCLHGIERRWGSAKLCLDFLLPPLLLRNWAEIEQQVNK